MEIDLTNLKKAVGSLEQAIRLYSDRGDEHELRLALRDSAIQRFEYTYELAWKAMKRWLSYNESPEAAEPVYSRKELFRLAARRAIIKDPLRWFTYHEARNISAHTYNEAKAKQVFEAANGIVEDVNYLIKRLETKND